MKGIFIPEITAEMFRNGCLESIEALMAEGEVYDIEYDPKSEEQYVPDRNVGDINKFIDSLEEIFADIRERHGDDSVCGLCEYDGAYIGQSGDWCNECPGFDRDDCFKLSDKCRKRWIDTITKALPSAQPKIITCENCKHGDTKPIADGRRLCDRHGAYLYYCSDAERRTDETQV